VVLILCAGRFVSCIFVALVAVLTAVCSAMAVQFLRVLLAESCWFLSLMGAVLGGCASRAVLCCFGSL
jgi:hypothetical protein